MQTVNQRGWALPPLCFRGSGHGVLVGQRGITHRGTGKGMQQRGRRMHTGKGCTQGLMESSIHPGELYQGLKRGINLARTRPAKIPDVQPRFLIVFIYLFFCSPWLISPENHAANSILLFFLPVQLLPPPPLGIVVAFLELSGGLFWHGRQK